MTVGELQVELAKLDAKLDAMILLNGSFSPVVDVIGVAGADCTIIRGKGKTDQPKKLSINEQGLLGYLVRLGLSNENIGEVLGRPTKIVEKNRKTLGF